MIGYHVTTAARADKIEQEGFRPGTTNLFCDDSIDYRRYYGSEPVTFMSTTADESERWQESLQYSTTEETEFAMLVVDCSGLRIAADIPRLMDNGATFQGGKVNLGSIEDPLAGGETSLADAPVPLHDLLTDDALIERCLDVTSTFCVLGPIPASRIRRREDFEI